MSSSRVEQLSLGKSALNYRCVRAWTVDLPSAHNDHVQLWDTAGQERFRYNQSHSFRNTTHKAGPLPGATIEEPQELSWFMISRGMPLCQGGTTFALYYYTVATPLQILGDGLQMPVHWPVHIWLSSWWGTSQTGRRNERSNGQRRADGRRRTVCPAEFFLVLC